MAKLVATSCPVCGAPVEVAPEAEQVTCPYCRQTSTISKRPAPSATTPSSTPAAHRPPKAFFIAGIIGGLVVVGVLGTFVTKSSPLKAPVQFMDQPFLFDVNGDGVTDVIGRTRRGEEAWIAAYDGRDGNELWATDPLPRDATLAESVRGLAGDKLVSVDGLGKVQTYHAKTGQPAWAALVSNPASSMCEGKDFVRIHTRDDATHDFSLSTGQKVKGEGACHPVATSYSPASEGYHIVGWSEFPALGLPRLNSIEDFSNHRALVHDEKKLAFMLGATRSGTQVPMVAAVEGQEVLWKSVVPGVDPLTTTVNVTTQVAAYANGRLIVPYDLKSKKGTRMAAFDATSGSRLWDVQIHDGTPVSSGLTATATNVYYATWTALYVFKADTGELVWKVGSDF